MNKITLVKAAVMACRVFVITWAAAMVLGAISFVVFVLTILAGD